MGAETRLAELGIALPEALPPTANYVKVVVVDQMAYVSGHGPQRPDGSIEYAGALGDTLTVKQGQAAARLTILNALASLRAELGSLDRVRRIVRLLGMVKSTPDFHRQPEVINGASDLLVEILGEDGRHARSAVGFVDLPRGMAVEIEMIAQIE